MKLKDLISFSDSFAHEITVIGTFFWFEYEFWHLKLTRLGNKGKKSEIPSSLKANHERIYLHVSMDDRQMCRWYAVIRHFA